MFFSARSCRFSFSREPDRGFPGLVFCLQFLFLTVQDRADVGNSLLEGIIEAMLLFPLTEICLAVLGPGVCCDGNWGLAFGCFGFWVGA